MHLGKFNFNNNGFYDIMCIRYLLKTYFYSKDLNFFILFIVKKAVF
ncbi:hypothetical protein NLO413_0035 [Candidatus Neoehrlichia lotoris str. RAC413]|uniref:Uncharacterized protein n=1 Tax=Candidatus Neoehrlichia procyonis str. RAC413 TaxID=1359163 RepID=A0A0F3NKX2_9RICK|nr:hypothetical protein NLO413_0035 [Candidatus Neoehrlichia lotoris str. RAC413]